MAARYALVQPMVVDEDSGELLYASYRTWWGQDFSVTPSQIRYLETLVDLLVSGRASASETMVGEVSLAANGWTWVDVPEKNA